MKAILLFLSSLFSVIFVFPAIAGGAESTNYSYFFEKDWFKYLVIGLFCLAIFSGFKALEYEIKKEKRRKEELEEFEKAKIEESEYYRQWSQSGAGINRWGSKSKFSINDSSSQNCGPSSQSETPLSSDNSSPPDNYQSKWGE
jgi:hypothetical protein